MAYCVSLSWFDQDMDGMEQINPMHKSLQSFEEIINSRFFRKTPIILLLCHADEFMQKIQEKNLQICFEDYCGDNSFADTIAFIKSKFIEKNHYQPNHKKEQRLIFDHVVTRADKDDCFHIFESMRTIRVQASLAKGGLV